MAVRNTLYVISVMAPDRPGIIADASAAIYDLGGNLEAMSQTIIQGWFTMLIRASFPDGVARDQVEETMARAGDFDVVVRLDSGTGGGVRVEGEPYVITVVGEDRPGIVRQLAQGCAVRGVNIDDVWNEVRNGRFITIFHVTVPRDVDPKDFRQDLEHAAAAMKVSLTLQHQDIFTATNSLQVHTRRPA